MVNISIALCTFNGAKFIKQQLESMITQTLPPDEIVVCDDLSNDETVSIIRDFSSTSPIPLRLYVNKINLGSTKNFEQAISLCEGDIIFLSDQDDIWHKKKIELMYEEFSKSKNTGMVFSDAEIVDENLNTLKHSMWDFSFPVDERVEAQQNGLFKTLLRKNVVSGATMAFRKKFRHYFLPIPTSLPNIIHDGWIALILSAISEVAFIDEPLIKYRQHSNQQLGIDSKFLAENKKTDRRNYFRSSLLNLQKELTKLSLLPEIINTYPQLKKEVRNLDINSLIKECHEERTELIYHFETRMKLSPVRVKRVHPIFSELLSGRYYRFSKGLKSGIKDLFESW